MVKALMYCLGKTSGTGLGTGTVKVRLNNNAKLSVPAWAKELTSVWNYTMSTGVVDSVKPCIPKFFVESDDVDVMPTELIPSPVFPLLSAATGELFVARPERYDLHIPLQGGEDFNFYGQSTVATTTAHILSATLLISDSKTGRQKYAKTGTATSTGTTASVFAAGTAYTIHGSEQIVEVDAVHVPTTPVAAKSHIGEFRLLSSDFLVSDTLIFNGVPAGAVGSTPGLSAPRRPVARYSVSVPTKSESCVIQDYLYVVTASTTAGYFLDGVQFYKTGRN